MDKSQSTASIAPQPLKVAWLFNCIGASGSLLYWNGILPPYLKRYPESWFFTARPPSMDIAETKKSVECVGSLKLPLGRRRGSYERQLVFGSPRIVGIVKELDPDVVVIQEFLSFAAYLAMFRWRLKNAKLLMLLESDPIRGIPSRKKWWTRSIRRWIASRMDHFLTNNEAGKNYLVDELNVDSAVITVKPYLVSEFAPSEESSPELPPLIRSDVSDSLVFLFVGQLVERKGVQQLIRAVALLDPETRNRIKFWLVGDGEQQQVLIDLARSEGVEGLFRFLGRIPYEELPGIYQSADAFVMPTLDDYRALVGFEAIGYGLPMLHSIYDGAVSEVVEEGQNGTCCDPRNPDQFAERIQWMVENADRFQEMAVVSRERHRSKYTIGHAVDALAESIEACYGAGVD